MTLPDPVESLFHEGTRQMTDGHAAAAEATFRRALLLDPDAAVVHANLGYLLDRAGRWHEAEQAYRNAIARQPWQVQVQLNLGAMLAACRRFDAAESVYREALRTDPTRPAAWSNLGVLLACTKRESEAEHCYRTAMTLDPAYRKAPFNLAYLLLRQGRYDEGWRRLEAREACLPDEAFGVLPRWQGEPLHGKTLLIEFEAGHGDMIQFCRFARLAKERGAARVSLLCHPALQPLLGSAAGVDEAIAFDQPMPAIDWHYRVAPMGMPRLFDTRLDSIPATLPYLEAPADRLHRWTQAFAAMEPGLRVGLVWKGNPRFENDGERSLPSLDALAPLGEVAGVRFFSLQKGAGQEQAAQPPAALALTDLAPHIADFADTAAIVTQLDLVITVDTAVAHLAGALAKRCWMMLPDYKTDWRWMAERDDTPWYPSVMRLFRQGADADWTPVIAAVKCALQALVGDAGPFS
ncbi:MAG TPA: tetratricopeptide repeat protein [Telluria sp.]|nr:tetratricopeptide repeat protein [Telluria sp.]